MESQLSDAVRAIGLLTPYESDEELGTAFAFTTRRALTARHSVEDLPRGGRVRIRLTRDVTLTARVGAEDARLDLALLELEEELVAPWRPVPLARRSEELRQATFVVTGYPLSRPVAAETMDIDGHVVNPLSTWHDGAAALQLFSHQVAAGFTPGGFSGAPVQIRMRSGAPGRPPEWTAVGVIVEGLVGPEGSAGHAGTIYASPVDASAGAEWDALAAAVGDSVSAGLPSDTLIRAFTAEYLGSPARRVAFGGRRTELDELDRFASGPDRLLVVTGPPGAGKSALLARFAARRAAAAGGLSGATVYVPISLRFGLSDEAAVLRALVARLAAAHGESPPPSEAGELRETLAGYLARTDAGGRAIVVVLDGVDEAGGWEPGPWLLPPDGSGVRLVLGARTRDASAPAGGWLSVLGVPAARVRTLTVRPLDSDGIHDVLLDAGLLPADPAGAGSLAAALARVTGGDALVLSLYIADALESPSTRRELDGTRLSALAPGLDGYMERWWADQEQLWGGALGEQAADVRLVLSLLACSLGPVTRRELVALARMRSDIDGDRLDLALRSLRRLVIAGADGWTIAHPELAAHRRRALEQSDDLTPLHELFARWGMRTVRDSGDIPAYVVRHQSEHMIAAGCDAAAFAFLASERWRLAWERTSDGLTGHLADVERARDVMLASDRARAQRGERPRLFVQSARCLWALARASDDAERPAALVGQLLRHGIWSQARALSYVHAHETSDRRAFALTAIAPHLDASGLLAGVDVLGQALDRASDQPDAWLHADALAAVVAGLCATGHRDAARDAVSGFAGLVAGVGELELAATEPYDVDALRRAVDALATLEDSRARRWTLLERVVGRIPADVATAALGEPAADWLTARLGLAHATDTESPQAVALVARWLDEADRRELLGALVARLTAVVHHGQRWDVVRAVETLRHVAPHLACDERRRALDLVASAQLGYVPAPALMDLLVLSLDCAEGDARAELHDMVVATLPVAMRAGYVTSEQDAMLLALAAIDEDLVLDALDSEPDDSWTVGGQLSAVAPALSPAGVRRGLAITAGIDWARRAAAHDGLLPRLAELSPAAAVEALAIQDVRTGAGDERKGLRAVVSALAGAAPDIAEVTAIEDAELRSAVLVAASHSGRLDAGAIDEVLRSFGDTPAALKTIVALRMTGEQWSDARIQDRWSRLLANAPYGLKGRLAIEGFLAMGRAVGGKSMLAMGFQTGHRFDAVAGWAAAAAARLGTLSDEELEDAADLVGYSELSWPAIHVLRLLRRSDALGGLLALDPGEAFLLPEQYADALELLPEALMDATTEALLPADLWSGSRPREDTLWPRAAIAFARVLPAARARTALTLVGRVHSGADQAALQAEIAIRLATLGAGEEALREAAAVGRRESAADALARMSAALAPTLAVRWFEEVLNRLAGPTLTGSRALVLSRALPSILALDERQLWPVLDCWLTSAPQSRGQVVGDLIALAPVAARTCEHVVDGLASWLAEHERVGPGWAGDEPPR